MTYFVVVHHKTGVVDHRGEAIRKECAHAGLKGVKKVRAAQAYEIAGTLSAVEVQRLADKVLADPVTQEAVLLEKAGGIAGARRAWVWPKTGVSDPVADTVRLAAKDVKIDGITTVRSGQVFDFSGALADDAVRRFCEEYLMNAMIQRVEVL
jgi:phosphoribosylformylglycinamidine (FGAM) synthase PurS component